MKSIVYQYTSHCSRFKLSSPSPFFDVSTKDGTDAHQACVLVHQYSMTTFGASRFGIPIMSKDKHIQQPDPDERQTICDNECAMVDLRLDVLVVQVEFLPWVWSRNRITV